MTERKALVVRLEAARNEWYRLSREASEGERHYRFMIGELEQHDRTAAKLYKGCYGN